MILDEIIIENFRQYYGKQSIKISMDKEKNVTVIHGENGEGKTAFLNLIKWCLYKKCYLPESDRIMNEKAEAELQESEYKEVSVEIKFEDRQKDYVVKRSSKYKKQDNKVKIISEDFRVISTNELGDLIEYKNPQNTINQILPSKIESYFFFDGERIDNLTKIEKAKDIKEIIKNIMGIEVIENAIKDLDKAQVVLRREFGKFSTNKDIKKFTENIEVCEAKLKSFRLNKSNLESTYKNILQEKNIVEKSLRKLDGAKEVQAKRDIYESRKKDILKKIENVNVELKDLYSGKGYLAFNDKLIKNVKVILEDKIKNGEISKGINQEFINDLLESRICICGRPLEHGTKECRTVEKWKENGGDSRLENAFYKISAGIKVVEKEKNILFEQLRHFSKQKNELSSELRQIKEALDEISAELNGDCTEDIQELETKRRDLELKSNKALMEIGAYKLKIFNAEKELNEFRNKIEVAEEEEQKSIVAKERFLSAEKAKNALLEILEITIETVRLKLQNKIYEVYNNFSKKGYIAIITENFELQIIKENDPLKRPVPMSQGERQITSLSFIGALIDIARERSEKNSDFFKGGIYPIVMDSPFGALDPEHKKRIAEGMPKLAEQIIILVTDSQWKGEVEENIQHKVGRAYKLINYNHRKDSNVKYEYTIIQEA